MVSSIDSSLKEPFLPGDAVASLVKLEKRESHGDSGMSSAICLRRCISRIWRPFCATFSRA